MLNQSLYILKGTVRLLSPAAIGSGRSEDTEMDLVRDGEGKPFIPATSLVGVLKSRIKLDDSFRENLNRFWGHGGEADGENDGRQSALCCSDLTFLDKKQDFRITSRDGIAIDSATGMVKPQALYDYQVIEKNHLFGLHLEIIVKNDDDVTFFQQMTAEIRNLLRSGNMAVGAKTNNGLGKIQLFDDNLYHVIFTEKEHVRNWFQYLENRDASVLPEIVTPESFDNEVIRTDSFSIEAELQLKTSVIVRTYPDNAESPDAVCVRSGDRFIIPGSSMKGALRGRAEKILNTLCKDKCEGILDRLFGYVCEDTDASVKGKLRIEEIELPNVQPELHTRVKIDRFTGGTIEGALFDSMPLFSNKNNSLNTVALKLTVTDYNDYEAGLLLLLLKDLWTGDLAVGGEKNIGRGVFKGKSALISLGKVSIEIQEDFSQLTDDKRKRLQGLVTQLSRHCSKDERGSLETEPV